ncbi:MAG TPA: proteasome ATPase [Streptosporangiaceae bacterium]
MASRDDSVHSGRHDDEVKVLTTQVSFLEEEVAALRGRLADSPRQAHLLEQRLREAESNLSSLTSQNERLSGTLREARDQIIALKEEVDRLAQPPSGFGVFLQANEDGTADVFTAGRKMRVSVSPGLELVELRPGQEVVLNEALNVVIAQGYETVGEVVMLKEVLDGGDRALVISHADEERVARLAEPLRDETLRPGDSLLLEPRSGYVYERIPKAEVEELILEEVPDITYSEIGGLGPQIEQIRDAIELPYLHADLFREHQLRPPKGVLLYGPPGCGKTLIAKAVANSLAKQVARRTAEDAKATTPADAVIAEELLPETLGTEAAQSAIGDGEAFDIEIPGSPAANGSDGHKARRQGTDSLTDTVLTASGQARERRSFFLNIKGPELLNKYVGETERHIRLVFQRAREKASEGMPVIVFFDEMDSIFRTRGSGVSSDVENTIVPQLLSEIDGVEGLENVIVIGASNREDMIDPAILRPGRLDVKIKIERPDAEAARDIFSKYVLAGLPLHPDDLAEHGGNTDATVGAMIQRVVERMYSETEENKFLEVTYANGDKEELYFRDFNSGAMIQNIVDRAKKMAIKEFLETGQKGLRVSHLLAACVDEFKENEDLPNTTNPDDWARISGKKGERIVYIRTLISGKSGTEAGRSIDTVSNTGQYL